MVDRFGLEDVYVYSTDFPHLEGSRDPIGKFSKWLNDLGPEFERRFFVDNGQLILPDL
jgi:uncharacterized protein